MELFAAVQPLVLSLSDYQLVYGEDDPEELALLQLQDKELATRIAEVLHDLYYLDTQLTEPIEGEGLSEEVGTTEDLHELRRIAAASLGKTPDDYYEGRVPTGFKFNHLINHSDADGYYVPYDFPHAFFLEEISIGSAPALLRELDELTELVAEQFPDQFALTVTTPDEEQPVTLTGPLGVWHSLRRLCRSAIELNMPIHLG